MPTLGAPAFILKARVQILRDIGGCQAPFNSWLTLQGIETLSLRMERHVANTRACGRVPAGASTVSWVMYPGLPSHPDHERAKKYLPKGAGAMLGFGIKGGVAAGKKFIDEPEAVQPPGQRGRRQEPGDPPGHDDAQPAERGRPTAGGCHPDFVRLSVGLEDIEDILWDLDQALQASAK